MDAFGDVSGHFRNLISHECEVVVAGIVMGNKREAMRCPKKTVRNVNNVKEARWNDLTDIQKRRMVECLADNDYLSFGYTMYTADQLHDLSCNYLLHQDVGVPEPWDLALTAYAYTEILFQHGANEENRLIFYLDRVASKKQTNRVIGKVQDLVELDQVFISDSAKVKGVQAADCFAGAVAEDARRGTSWLDEFDHNQITEAKPAGLPRLENDLVEYDKNQARR